MTDVSYTVMGSPKREDLTGEKKEQMKTLKPIEDVLSKLLAAQAGSETETAVQFGERMLDCDNLSPKASEITLDIEGV